MISRLRGPGLHDYALLVHRSPAPDVGVDERLESVILRGRGDQLAVVYSGPGYIWDLWMTPSGRLYCVGEFDRAPGLYEGRPFSDGTYDWSRVAAVTPPGASPLELVWGLGDDCVFVWGGGVLTEDDADVDAAAVDPPFVWHWSGAGWRPVASPGRLYAMHGTSPDSVFAVGRWGLFAHWDGHYWRALEPPANGASIQFVHARGDDEVYACSLSGEVYEASVHGIRHCATSPTPLFGVVVVGDRVLLAGGFEGTLELTGGDTVAKYAPHARAFAFQPVADGVMFQRPTGAESTTDFQTFRTVSSALVGQLLGAHEVFFA